MIVEFIGCTGSGKTRLINELRSGLGETTRTLTAYELIASKIGLGKLTNPTAQNLVQELVCLPYSLRAMLRYRAYIAETVRLFVRNSRLSSATINNVRSLERKIGLYEITRRHNRETIILVDEGPIQAAHMFVFNPTPLAPQEINRFASLLPLPDLIVYVRSPFSALLKRTDRRRDPPREMVSKDRTSIEDHIRSAVGLFDTLIQCEDLRDRTLIVENPYCTRREYEQLVARTAESILAWRSRSAKTLYPGHLPLVAGGERC